MNTLEAIESRSSTRHFKKDPVAKEIVTTLLKAAMCAPSARNKQPWHFVVIDKREILDKIPTFSPYAQMCKEAPLAILVCGDTSIDNDFWVQDCSAATQNLLLAAHEKGLGAVWTGVFPNEDRVQGFRIKIHLPPEITPLALVVLGYGAESSTPHKNFQENRIHNNQW